MQSLFLVTLLIRIHWRCDVYVGHGALPLLWPLARHAALCSSSCQYVSISAPAPTPAPPPLTWKVGGAGEASRSHAPPHLAL